MRHWQVPLRQTLSSGHGTAGHTGKQEKKMYPINKCYFCFVNYKIPFLATWSEHKKKLYTAFI